MDFFLLNEVITDCLKKTDSLQNQLNIKLLEHLLLTLHCFSHTLPALTQSTIRTHFVNDIGHVCKQIKVLSFSFLAFFVEKEPSSDVKFEGHEGKVAHEEHEAEDGTDKSTNIREELVSFVEGSFVGGLTAGFKEDKTSKTMVFTHFVGQNLKGLIDGQSGLYPLIGKWKQTLISLNGVILDISYPKRCHLTGKGKKIAIIDIISKVVCFSRVDQGSNIG